MIWLKLAPYLVGLALLIGAGIGIDRHRHSVDTAAFDARWTARDLSERKAADTAIAAHQAALDAASKRNEEIERALNDKKNEATAAARDRDLARRLLAQARTAASSGPMPPAQGQPAANPQGAPGGDAGAGQLSQLVAAALTECRQTADDWDGLQAELTPQLK